MGAKRLKAIALRGRGGVRLSRQRDRTGAIANRLRERAGGPATAEYRVSRHGCELARARSDGAAADAQLPLGDFRSRRVGDAGARAQTRGQYLELRAGCAGCPVQCEHMYVRRGAPRERAAASEYESVWAFGPNCGVGDWMRCSARCARADAFGLDTISTGATSRSRWDAPNAG